jgi:4-carboxymuconolactone decarboxylase
LNATDDGSGDGWSIMKDTAVLDGQLHALVRFALAVASGHEPLLVARAADMIRHHVPVLWVDELLLQSVLMVGYPRALVAAGIWRRESRCRAPATDASLKESLREWERRGEATCRTIYGGNYDRLRENVRALHPALDASMVAEGYGRVLSRPGLDLMRRELCTVAQIAWLDSPHQLHSHLRGALHAGARVELVGGVLEAISADLSSVALGSARAVWDQVRKRQESEGET